MRFIGDVHGKYNQYKNIIVDCPASIQVGDMGVGFKKWHGGELIFDKNPPFDAMAHGNHRFIRGNHDNPNVCRNHKFWIADGTVENDMMFIGGADSIDKAWRTEGISWWADEQLSMADWNVCFDTYVRNKPRIMVTHDCPRQIYPHLHSHHVFENADDITSRSLDFIFNEWKPEIWIFGHHHKSFDQVIDGTRFICLNELEFIDLEV
jgi:predicted phosphodiesterase